MGKTSTKSKRKYNDKTYSRIVLDLHKDTAEQFRAKCQATGIAQAAVLKAAINKFLKEDIKMFDKTAGYEWFNATARRDWNDWSVEAAANEIANWPDGTTPPNCTPEHMYGIMSEIIAEYDEINK